jgi:hypothetical protein
MEGGAQTKRETLSFLFEPPVYDQLLIAALILAKTSTDQTLGRHSAGDRAGSGNNPNEANGVFVSTMHQVPSRMVWPTNEVSGHEYRYRGPPRTKSCAHRPLPARRALLPPDCSGAGISLRCLGHAGSLAKPIEDLRHRPWCGLDRV